MRRTTTPCAEQAILDWINQGADEKSQWAMDCLYRTFHDRVVGWAVKHGGSPDTGHDVLVDALVSFGGAVELGKYSRRFAAYPDFERFFMRIAMNKFYNLFRGNGGTSFMVELPDDPRSPDDVKVVDPFDDLEMMQGREKLFMLVEDNLHKLSLKCRDRLNRFFWLNQSDVEIANALGDASPGVSKQMRYKCLEKIRKMISK